MPRQPTGRPRGRPVGSGAILEREQRRLTVRIPATLYDRLEAFAEGLHFTHGTPQLAGCVRDALEHFLVCPQKRQTQTVHTAPSVNNGQTTTVQTVTSCDNGQTENSTEIVLPMSARAEDTIRQTGNGTALAVLPVGDTEEDNRQTKKRTQHLTDDLEDMPLHPETASVTPVCQPENVPADAEKSEPGYDPTRYQLGALCRRGHAYGNTGESLRELRGGKVADCVTCHRARATASNARRLAKSGAGQ